MEASQASRLHGLTRTTDSEAVPKARLAPQSNAQYGFGDILAEFGQQHLRR